MKQFLITMLFVTGWKVFESALSIWNRVLLTFNLY